MDIGRILPTEAAAILNVSPQFVRVAMQQGKLPIGTAVQMSSIWTYHISEKLLADYSGKNIEKEIEGVFGASDVALGALESGVSFEKRILDIYQNCKNITAVRKAFAALNRQLDARKKKDSMSQVLSDIKPHMTKKFMTAHCINEQDIQSISPIFLPRYKNV